MINEEEQELKYLLYGKRDGYQPKGLENVKDSPPNTDSCQQDS